MKLLPSMKIYTNGCLYVVYQLYIGMHMLSLFHIYTNIYVIIYMWQVVHRYAGWIGGLSHQSSNLSHLCNLLQKVVIRALSDTNQVDVGSELPD